MNYQELFGINHKVAENLNTYLENSFSEFAILLKGDWGCGKTFFIKSFMENFSKENQIERTVNNKQKRVTPTFCYISLFGLKELSEVDSAILAEAMPIFHSGASKKFGRLGSRVLDLFGKLIPMGDDIKEYGEKITTFFVEQFNKLPDNLVLVLDDIERSSIEITDVLGYCNNLLTTNKAKIILLADESKFSDHDKDYKNFKEKIIGKTLIIESDPKHVFETTVEKFKIKELQEVINNYKDELLLCYQIENYKNLRVLQYFLYEAEIFLSLFNEKEKKNNNTIILSLLKALFYITFMKHVDNITFKDIQMVSSFQIRKGMGLPEKDDNTTSLPNKASHYSNLLFGASTNWDKYYWDENIYDIIINDYILEHEDIQKNEEINFNQWNCTHSELLEKDKIINEKLSQKKYTKVNDILKIARTKFFLVQEKIIDINYSDIAENIISYIKKTDFEKEEKNNKDGSKYDFEKEAKFRAYYDNENFKKILNALVDKVNQQNNNNSKELIKQFLEKLNDYDTLSKSIGTYINQKSPFYIYDIPPKEFLNAFIPCSKKSDIIYKLDLIWTRYAHQEDNCKICDWWKELYKNFNEHKVDNDNNWDYSLTEKLLKEINLITHKNPFVVQDDSTLEN